MSLFLRKLDFFRYNYLKTWVVAGVDVFLSTLVSTVILLVINPYNVPLTKAIVLDNMLMSALASAVAFYLLKTYRNVIRYSATKDLWRIALAICIKMAIAVLLAQIKNIPYGYELLDSLLLDLVLTFVALVAVRIVLGVIYSSFVSYSSMQAPRVLIYGMDEGAVSLCIRLHNGDRFRVVGFLTRKIDNDSYCLRGEPVFCFSDTDSVSRIVSKTGASKILFSNYKYVQQEKEKLIQYCQKAKIGLLIAPPLDEVSDDNQLRIRVRPIRIDDVLGRTQITTNMDAIREYLRDKVVLVTGAAGSIGSEFCRQVAPLGIHKLILLDVAESPMHSLRLEIEQKFPYLQFVPIIGDVRNRARLDQLFATYKPNIVFHAAAYKHVPLMEENPCEALRVNVYGSRLVADLAVQHGVEKFILLSTDKAVNPTNVMGASKRLAEMYVQALGMAISRGEVPGSTRFVTTRFGNVIGSAGSVVPMFRRQIAQGGPLTVTDERITRFFMSIPEACRLIMEAATLSNGNEVMAFEMGQPIRIVDIARKMIELSGFTPDVDIKIKYIGLRPGEKLYEEVFAIGENVEPTQHPQIFVAKVRQEDYKEVSEQITQISELAYLCRVEDSIRLLKKAVPEYVSNNSEFGVFDKKTQ